MRVLLLVLSPASVIVAANKDRRSTKAPSAMSLNSLTLIYAHLP